MKPRPVSASCWNASPAAKRSSSPGTTSPSHASCPKVPSGSKTWDEQSGLRVLEVPALWPLEVADALTALVRRRKLAEEDRQTGLGWLRALPIRIDHEMASLAFSKLS